MRNVLFAATLLFVPAVAAAEECGETKEPCHGLCGGGGFMEVIGALGPKATYHGFDVILGGSVDFYSTRDASIGAFVLSILAVEGELNVSGGLLLGGAQFSLNSIFLVDHFIATVGLGVSVEKEEHAIRQPAVGASVLYIYRGFETDVRSSVSIPVSREQTVGVFVHLTSLYLVDIMGIGFMYTTPHGIGPRMDVRLPLPDGVLRLFLSVPLYQFGGRETQLLFGIALGSAE